MRTAILNVRSFAFSEASLLGVAFGVVTILAFARLWQLMVTEEWLAPLVVMVAVQFASAMFVGYWKGTLTKQAAGTEVLIVALIFLAYAAGFAVQRMWAEAPRGTFYGSLGHATSGSLIMVALARFLANIRAAKLKVPALDLIYRLLEQTVAGQLRKQAISEKTDEAKAEGVITGARKGWQAARKKEWETGIVGPPPKQEELSGIIPAVKVDSDPEIEAPEDK
jgi:hypothetical protein